MTNLRQRLFDTGMFKDKKNTYDLHADVVNDRDTEYGGEQTIRVILRFNPHGDLDSVDAVEIDTAMQRIVAGNRQALGLPPQEM